MDTQIEKKGLVDAADRLLRELIRTPKFKQTLIILLNSIDPPAARRLVRTFFWQDPGLLLSIVGTLPDLINTGSEALAEVAAQMNSMPPPLLRDLLGRIVSGIDGEAAGEAAGGLVKMALSLEPREDGGGLEQGLSGLAEGFGRGYAACAGEAALTSRLDGLMAGMAERARDKDSATSAFIRAAGEAMRNNPDFVEHVLQPLLSPALQAPRKSSGKTGKAAGPGQPGKGQGGEGHGG